MMTRPELIEKMAQVICEYRTQRGAWEHTHEVKRADWRRDALAAIAAIEAAGCTVASRDAINRALTMLTVAADYIQNNDLVSDSIFFDDAECDGGCVAEDCRAAHQALAASPLAKEASHD